MQAQVVRRRPVKKIKWFDRLFSTCNRQLADSPGGQTEDSWANGLRFKSAPLWSLCYFFLFQIEDLDKF